MPADVPSPVDAAPDPVPAAEPSDDFVRELRAENSREYAERGVAHSCLFTGAEDHSIPAEWDGCGGCSCHLSAPCRHCLRHLDVEEAHYIRTMTALAGRGSQGHGVHRD